MSIRPFGISVHGQLNRIRNTLRDLEQQVASVHNRLPCAQGISEEEVEQETEIPGAPEESYFFGHVVEDGPLEVPQLLIQRAIDLLPPYIDFPEDRALRVWRAGHWCWAALATHTEYNPLGALCGEQPRHWLVLRGQGVEKPYRTTSYKEALHFIQALDGREVIEEFKFFVEVQIFCAGAKIKVPRWFRLREID